MTKEERDARMAAYIGMLVNIADSWDDAYVGVSIETAKDIAQGWSDDEWENYR